MDRRHFLKTSGTALAATKLTSSALAQKSAEVAPGRLVLPMNRGWRYSPSVTEAAHSIDFDDSGFAAVVVPHTNVRLPWHSFDDRSYEFVSLYRRGVKVPAEAQGKRVFVDFEGVMTASTVWFNGKKLGEYKGGYTPFSFELTGLLDPAGKNVLAVDVDSTERADIPPFGNEIDYLTFGGIYREVALRIVPQTYIENIHAQPKDVLGLNPSVDVACVLDRASGSSSGKFYLRAELLDGDRVLARATGRVPTPAPTERVNADDSQAAGAAASMPIDVPTHTLTLTKLGAIFFFDMENT